jgi:tetrahydromethanopterin S-methyltransferase subunit A
MLTVGPPAPADPAGLAEAAEAAKCAACGCAHQSVAALAALPATAPPRLRNAARRLSASLRSQRYSCLGCAVCWPAQALSLVQEAGLVPDGAACPAEPVVPRPGWPPLPGDYTVLRYRAPVAVCTLGDSDLAAAVAARAGPQVAITGTLTTENLGIERLVANTITNPNLRFVIVCGAEVEQRIGHHPGGSLLALAARGTDERARIIAAPGRRPRLRNLTPTAGEKLGVRSLRRCRSHRPGHRSGRSRWRIRRRRASARTATGRC